MKSIKIVWVGRIVTGLISLPFIFSATTKFFHEKMFPDMVQEMERIGLPMSILLPVGILELLCVVFYLIPKTSVLGAVLFTGYLGGAILTHLRIEDNVAMHVVFGLLVWLGIYLREPRLHQVLPFRKK